MAVLNPGLAPLPAMGRFSQVRRADADHRHNNCGRCRRRQPRPSLDCSPPGGADADNARSVPPLGTWRRAEQAPELVEVTGVVRANRAQASAAAPAWVIRTPVIVMATSIVVLRTGSRTAVLVLRGCQQLVRFAGRNPEHDWQILRLDAVPVHEVKALQSLRCAIGHYLPAGEGKQPGAQLVRIVQQGPCQGHDGMRGAVGFILLAGQSAAVRDEVSELGVKPFVRRRTAGRVRRLDRIIAPPPASLEIL